MARFEGSQNGPGSTQVSSITFDRNAAYRFAEPMNDRQVIIFLCNDKAERTAGGGLQDQVVNAARVVGHQQYWAFRWQRVTGRNFQFVEESAVEPVQIPDEPKVPWNL